MFKTHNVITAIELGSSKICVLVGESAGDGSITVIGRGEASAQDALLKGEIIDMDLALERLTEALDRADENSGRQLNNCALVVLNLTACGIGSFLGHGTAFVQNAEQRISNAEIDEATRNAKVKPLSQGQCEINTFDAYFVLDETRRVSRPLDQIAHTLEAYSHVIHGDGTRVKNMISLLSDAGFEEAPTLLFNPIADVYGVMTDEEKDGGTLLVDYGAGVTDYTVVVNGGVLASGHLDVGFDHVANDLAVAFSLPFPTARKLIHDRVIEQAVKNNQPVIVTQDTKAVRRSIPTESFTKVIDARIRETFNLICDRLCRESFWRSLANGGILTGGGAKFFRSAPLFQDVFEMNVRTGLPLNVNGALTDLEDPRYSTVWGMLRFGEKKLAITAEEPEGLFGMISGFGDFMDRFRRKVRRNLKS